MSNSKIDLGFAEPFSEAWRAKCKFFPSKVGGVPSFLALKPVLGPNELTCGKCGKIMQFILQVYAPLDHVPEAFHRTLFVFACAATEQCVGQFAVFRCQLSRENEFYSVEPPNYEADSTDYDPNPEKLGVKLCPVCNVAATKHCAQCSKVNYCSREHQVAHWKMGGHRQVCTGEQRDHPSSVNYDNLVLTEYELLIEDEEDKDEDEDDESEVTESEMSKYKEFLRNNKPTLQSENIDEPEEDEEEQKIFERFKKLTKAGEVIRYRSDWATQGDSFEEILWISKKNQIERHKIPRCSNCHSERRFEFQIVPELLNKIKKKSPDGATLSSTGQLDFGTLMVFSCAKGCIKSNPDHSKPLDFYLPEFIFNQPV